MQLQMTQNVCTNIFLHSAIIELKLTYLTGNFIANKINIQIHDLKVTIFSDPLI